MKALILLTLTSLSYASNNIKTITSGSIRGTVAASMTQQETFEVKMKAPLECTPISLTNRKALRCKLDKVEGSFLGPMKNTVPVVFNRSLTVEFENGTIQHTYDGEWTMVHNGKNIAIPFQLILNEKKTEPNVFGGYVRWEGNSLLLLRGDWQP